MDLVPSVGVPGGDQLEAPQRPAAPLPFEPNVSAAETPAGLGRRELERALEAVYLHEGVDRVVRRHPALDDDVLPLQRAGQAQQLTGAQASPEFELAQPVEQGILRGNPVGQEPGQRERLALEVGFRGPARLRRL